MEEKETGGPAFPHMVMGDLGQTREVCEGMTLRDYFAVHLTMPNLPTDQTYQEGIVGRKRPDTYPNFSDYYRFMMDYEIAMRYILADKLLMERSK